MKRLAVFALLAASTAPGADLGRILYRASQAAVAGANVADVHSSRGLYEANPILGKGRFGIRQTAIKGAMLGSLLTGEEIITRRRPRHRAAATLLNFVAAAGLSAVAAHNYRLKRRP